MDVGKRGSKPPLPRSREGNESPKRHCHEEIMMGRRVSRPPEAGRPIHLSSSRGEIYAPIIYPVFSDAVGFSRCSGSSASGPTDRHADPHHPDDPPSLCCFSSGLLCFPDDGSRKCRSPLADQAHPVDPARRRYRCAGKYHSILHSSSPDPVCGHRRGISCHGRRGLSVSSPEPSG